MFTSLLVALGLLIPQCEYVVTTYSGDIYVIGVGDSCADAWQDHGPIPEDFRVIEARHTFKW